MLLIPNLGLEGVGMEIYQFSKEVGKRISQFDSDFIMSHILQTENPAHIGCMHLERQGKIGYHKAIVSQLLLIIGGEGEVCGDDKVFLHVKKGDAVFWEKGEFHETFSEERLTAIVIEGEDLKPSMLKG